MRRTKKGKHIGTAQITPAQVKACQKCSFIIKYTAGPRGINEGGSLVIQIPWGFTAPSLIKGTEPGFCRTSSDNDKIRLNICIPNISKLYYPPVQSPDSINKYLPGTRWGRNVLIKLTKGRLREGESIFLYYGGRRNSLDNEAFNTVTSPYFSMKHEFSVAVDCEGDKRNEYPEYRLIGKQPYVMVEPLEPSGIRVVIPSIIKPDENIKVRYAVIDKLKNIVNNMDCPCEAKLFNGKTNGETNEESKASKKNGGEAAGTIDTGPVREYGIKRFNIISGKITGITNPGIVTDSNKKIFWGDIHGHTELSDGLGSAKDYYTFAKKYAMLDFSAITDHDVQISDEDWEEIKEQTFNFNEADEFVTLLAYEFDHKPEYGHKNVYYPGDDGPLLRGTEGFKEQKKFNDINKFVQRWKDNGAMLILHQHAKGMDSFYDPDLVRLAEIYSNWGSSEYYGSELPLRLSVTDDFTGQMVQDGLNMGYKTGIMASSDDHMGHPGFTDWLRTMKVYKGGLTAVIAENLTRDDIFNALWNRRCYATTGERIFVDFRINGNLMGEIINVPGKIEIEASAAGMNELEYIKIIKNNRELFTYECDGCQAHFKVNDFPDRNCFYYLRVRQKDGNMAWSSPIWLQNN